MHSNLLAQIINPVLPESIGQAPATGGSVVGMLIGNIMGGILIIAFLMAFLILVMGGLSWITGGGDKAKLESARNKITHAIVGLIIIAAVWAIMSLLGSFLGISFPNLEIPTINSTTAPSGVNDPVRNYVPNLRNPRIQTPI